MKGDTSALSDAKAVAAALQERDKFAVLVERYETALMRYIRRLGCTDEELAKDILQESFINAYINLNDFDSSLSFNSWIYRIVHNEAVSHFRSVRIRPAPVDKEEDLVLFLKIPDELDLLLEADARILKTAIQRALSSLQEKYRDVLVLRFFEEKSYDEIADILKIPNGTVATHLGRAKVALRELLQKDKTLNV